MNKTVWALGIPGSGFDGVLGAPIYANGLVVVTGRDLLDVLNSTTGKVLFSYTATGAAPFLAAPSITYATIYVESSNGLVLAFSLPSGGADPAGFGTSSPTSAHAPLPSDSPIHAIIGTFSDSQSPLLVAATTRRA